jgi:hypothetical protein
MSKVGRNLKAPIRLAVPKLLRVAVRVDGGAFLHREREDECSLCRCAAAAYNDSNHSTKPLTDEDGHGDMDNPSPSLL